MQIPQAGSKLFTWFIDLSQPQDAYIYTMAVDALAPSVTMPSAAMILITQNQQVFVANEEEFQLHTSP